MKRITRFIIIILLSSWSFSAMSQDMSAMKNMMQTQMMATCEDKGFLSCVGISKKKCTFATNKAMSSCDHLFPKNMNSANDTAMDKHGECLTNNLLKYAGVSSNKLDNCEPDSSAPPMDESKMLEMVSEAFKQHAQSIGTTDVTLPIYKNATVIAHATAEMRTKMFAKESLAMVSLDSADSVSKIASFYRGKLKGFKEYKFEDGILFLKNGPKNYNISRDLNKTFTNPNVYISSIPGSSIRIDITYKK